MGGVGRWAAAAAVGAVMAAQPGAAAAREHYGLNDFQRCDGYQNPYSRTMDGMMPPASSWDRFNYPAFETRDEEDIAFGAAGVAACDRALTTLPRYIYRGVSDYWLRQLSLLRSRAQHRLEAGDAAGALSDLDAADALGRRAGGEVWYGRGLGFGSALLRAAALRRTGDVAGSDAILARIEPMRPYDGDAQLSLLAVRGPTLDPEAFFVAVRRLARLDPLATRMLFLGLFGAGRCKEALALDVLYAPLPADSDPDEAHMAQAAARKAAFEADIGGMQAYCRANLGQARQPAGSQAEVGEGAAARLGRYWSAAADIRALVRAGRPSEAVARLAELEDDGAKADIYEALGATDPAYLAKARDLRAELTRKLQALPLQALYRGVPAAESSFGLPPWREAPRPILGKGPVADQEAQGWRVTALAGGLYTVRMRGAWASGAMTMEAALLRAAELALEQGRPGLLVRARRSTSWIIHTMGQVGPGYDTNNGYEVELDVMLVDPGSMPLGFEGEAWRVLDAAAVRQVLTPLYHPAKGR